MRLQFNIAGSRLEEGGRKTEPVTALSGIVFFIAFQDSDRAIRNGNLQCAMYDYMTLHNLKIFAAYPNIRKNRRCFTPLLFRCTL